MNRIVTFILTFIAFIIGALIVFAAPSEPGAIIIGMFLVSVAILNLAIQIYFPPSPQQEVELRVVEEPIKENKIPVKVEKTKKMPIKIERAKRTSKARKR